jgi:hypothetical protein
LDLGIDLANLNHLAEPNNDSPALLLVLPQASHGEGEVVLADLQEDITQ